MVFSNNLLMGAAGQSTGYEIDQSIRFDKATSSHLSNTYGSAGNRKTWTFSTWFKRGKIDGTRQSLFAAAGPAYLQVGPDAAAREMITILNEGSGTDLNWYTTQVFRDPGAWYHLVWQFDSTQADADNRTKLYINGAQVTEFTKVATPAQNFDGAINNAVEHRLGELHIANYYFDGYQAEINFIDGTALDPTAFGKYNNDGVWVPIAYSGAYGDNGFFIDGRDSSDLGDDESGNGNDFASSGLTAADQMLDTPTNNFCTWNPLRKGPAHTLSDGNLLITSTLADATFGTFMVDSGKWYWEVTALSVEIIVGIGDPLSPPTAAFDTTAAVNSRGYNGYNGKKENNGTGSAYGATFTTNDVIGVALNMDDGEITFYKNNSSQGVAFTGLTGLWGPAASVGNTRSCRANFGQSAFTYTPPTGFVALNTANLATPTIADGSAYFQPTLYEGNGSTQSIDQDGNSTFQPDWVWIKNRDATDQHALFDVVRGATELMGTNATTAEATNDDTLTGFESDGFALGDDVIVNTNNESYVAWQWKANGSGSSNEDGSINTTATTANTTAGFSISTYTGNATVGATVGHGLGIAPKVVIVKSRSNVENWIFGHDSVGWNKAMYMSSTGAPFTLDIYWNNTAPTSSVVTLHDHVVTNGSGATYVMYSFAEIPGYSSFGSYTGNGSATDGTFVYTGFTPRYVLFKRTNAAESWPILDTARGSSFGADAGATGNNPTAANDLNSVLVASTTAAEEDNASGSRKASFNSNGFKVRTTNTAMNGSGSTYIYMAFAEHPFGGEDVAPATAR